MALRKHFLAVGFVLLRITAGKRRTGRSMAGIGVDMRGRNGSAGGFDEYHEKYQRYVYRMYLNDVLLPLVITKGRSRMEGTCISDYVSRILDCVVN